MGIKANKYFIGNKEITPSAEEINKLNGVTATTAEINKLASAGDAIASGTQVDLIADIANDATGTQVATAVNAINAALKAFGIVASE